MSRTLSGAEDELDKSKSDRSAKNRHPKDRKRPSDCRELFSNLSDYLDGKMEARTCEQMREHIEACPACVAFLRDLWVAIDRCRSLEFLYDPAVSPRLRSILTQEYLRLLNLPTAQKMAVAL